MCSDAPDTSGMNAAAQKSAELSEKAFDWFSQEYARTQGQRDATQALSNQVAQAQLAGMTLAQAQAKESYDRNKATFQPLQDKLIAEAEGYDTAGRRTQAANEARAGVEANMGAAQQGLQRSLARSGVQPGSGRSLALMQDAALAKGAAVAGASSKAVKDVEQQGYARRMDAAGLGMGVLGNQATQQQIATSTGGAAVAASGAANAAGMSGTGLMNQGFGTALQGVGQAGSLYGNIAGVQSATRGQDYALLGSAFNAAGSAFAASDKQIKSNTGKPGDAGEALAQVNRIQVDGGWSYDPKKGGPNDGGAKHTGPMAQQVRAVMGNDAAPGGTKIDLVTMNGKTLLAVQELSKQVRQVERKLAKMKG